MLLDALRDETGRATRTHPQDTEAPDTGMANNGQGPLDAPTRSNGAPYPWESVAAEYVSKVTVKGDVELEFTSRLQRCRMPSRERARVVPLPRPRHEGWSLLGRRVLDCALVLLLNL